MAKKWTKYTIEDLYQWIDEGQPMEVEEGFAVYVNMLDKIRSMMLRADKYGSKEVIVRHLLTFEEDIGKNRLIATRLYNEAVEYFYSDNAVSKQAWRNLYAEDLDKAYNLAMSLAENTADIERATKIKERAAKMRGLDKEDPVELPEGAFQKPLKVYTMEMDKHFELPNEDRKAIELWIDENTKELTEKARDRIKQEAQIIPVKVFQEAEENPRKDL